MDMGEVIKVGLYLLPLQLLAFAAQYAGLRVRNLYAARPDRQLGRKAVCHLFLSVAIGIGLAGLTLSVLDILDRVFEPLHLARAAAQPGGTPVPPGPTEWFDEAQRIALGLVLSGLFHGTLMAVVLRLFTNDRDEPAVRRAFTGNRLVFAGLIWMASATAALTLLFQKDTDLKALQTTTAVGCVWGVAAAVHLWLLLHGRKGAEVDGG